MSMGRYFLFSGIDFYALLITTLGSPCSRQDIAEILVCITHRDSDIC
jgi:hypothetical protein